MIFLVIILAILLGYLVSVETGPWTGLAVFYAVVHINLNTVALLQPIDVQIAIVDPETEDLINEQTHLD